MATSPPTGPPGSGPGTLQRLDLRGRDGDVLCHLPRPELAGDGPIDVVRAILADVRDHGDDAVRRLTEKFDGAVLGPLQVPPGEVAAALDAIPAALRAALEAAHAAIADYHQTQRPTDPPAHQRDGVTLRDLRRPVDRAGMYVPGGRTPLHSTVLMTAVPARTAGVGQLVLCTPPAPDGTVAPATLAAAALAGVDEVYRIGGAQAIGAMAYGTESIRPVDLIVGPGNVFVALAKQEVAQAGLVGVPSAFAGPSEVVVIADDDTPVELAAIDIIVQAEHGPDGLAWLVTWSEKAADRITDAVAALTAAASRRTEIESTLARGGYCVLVDGPEQALEVANAVAPEHLELMSSDPESLLPLIRNAGAVFCGPYSPAALGVYLAGPSHVLPTYASARFASGLNVDDFLKRIHVIDASRPAIAALAHHIEAIAESEGLAAHAESIRMRVASAATEDG
jgi:histidinol dehydrogenase